MFYLNSFCFFLIQILCLNFIFLLHQDLLLQNFHYRGLKSWNHLVIKNDGEIHAMNLFHYLRAIRYFGLHHIGVIFDFHPDLIPFLPLLNISIIHLLLTILHFWNDQEPKPASFLVRDGYVIISILLEFQNLYDLFQTKTNFFILLRHQNLNLSKMDQL